MDEREQNQSGSEQHRPYFTSARYTTLLREAELEWKYGPINKDTIEEKVASKE